MSDRTALDRRGFLAAGGALLVTVALPPATGRAAGPDFAPNAFIRIDRTGRITLVMPMAEMGQGILAAQARLLAEELEVGLDQVQLESAPADDALYANPRLRGQATGGSTSVRAFWTPLREAGAIARTMLIAAAARKWDVKPSACRAERGAVRHAATGRSLRYGDLVDIAAALPIPAPGTIALKDPKDFTLLGKPLRRPDTADKVNGRTRYGIDVTVPGMKIAAIAISPVVGGKPAAMDEAAASAVGGVRQVVVTDDAVAVVADHMWAARKGLEAAAIVWDDGPNAGIDSAGIVRALDEASQKSGAVARNDGDADAALAASARRVDAVYQLPFLAHAALEPLNCTVHVREDGCDIWGGTQAPVRAQAVAAGITGLPQASIKVHNHILGGAFGRRLEVDGVAHAVRIARRVRGPVKVVWSREEDTRHDMYRPYYYDRLSAGLDNAGRPMAWTHRVSGSSIMARVAPAVFARNNVDPDGVDGAAEPPYALPNIRVEFQRVEPEGVRTSWWRGVGPAHNVFVVESFIDELAALAGADPVAYRRSLLGHNPRALAVLDLAAARSGWGGSMPPRHGRGVAVQFAFGSYLAAVAEAEVRPDGSVRVHRVVCAVDCGLVVNPDIIAAQMEGGAVYGLTAVLYGAITLKNGRVEQGNFDSYPPLRIDEAPVVETHIVPSGQAPGGIGETATAAIGPAVTNAIFAATGRRLRTLPVDTTLLRSS